MRRAKQLIALVGPILLAGGCRDAVEPRAASPDANASTNTVLSFSTYLGGEGMTADIASDIAVDAAGNVYVVGSTTSPVFPTTSGAFQTARAGPGNAFVTKLTPDGSALIYSTYLGGNGSGSSAPFDDRGSSIAVDASGNVWVAGLTTSTNFPTTSGAVQTTYGGGHYDAFVTKLDATGSALLYSTYLGGSGGDFGGGIALDAAGNAYVTGTAGSSNFPTTLGAFQATCPGAFVAKLTPDHGAGLLYSTCLGSPGSSAKAIAVDPSGHAYVTGSAAADFPVTPGAFQTTFGGDVDAFVAKLNRDGTALVYATYLGGSSDERGAGIAIDASGHAYVTGDSRSTDFPTTPGSLQATSGGFLDAFVTKLNPGGTGLDYSTYLGGNGYDGGAEVAVDPLGHPYVTGSTTSTDFPTTSGAFRTTLAGSGDAFVATLNRGASGLVSSTYLGGSNGDEGTGLAVAPSGHVYVTGSTWSRDFPTTAGAFQPSCWCRGGTIGAFVVKLEDVRAGPR
jgi:hypothetical protein